MIWSTPIWNFALPSYSKTGGCLCIHTAAFWWRNRSGRRDIMFHHCHSDRHLFMSWKNKKSCKIILDSWFPFVKKILAKAAKPLWHITVSHQQALLPQAIHFFLGSACLKPCSSLWRAWVGKPLFAVDWPKACDFNNWPLITGTAVRSNVSVLMDERIAVQTETCQNTDYCSGQQYPECLPTMTGFVRASKPVWPSRQPLTSALDVLPWPLALAS